MSNLLEIRKLSKSYRSGETRLQVLRDLNLDLQRGEILAITGTSGSGKSTFLHLAGAMERADAGSIVFEGTEVTCLDGDARAAFRNREVGFVFQFHHLLPEFTAEENVMMPLLLRGLSRGQAQGRARQLLDEVGLIQRGHHKPGQLSGGEQQRVAVARALVGRPRLLLADEPTGDLDEHTSESIHRLLLDVHRRHDLTSVIVTHDPNLAALCRRRCRMEGGRLVFTVGE